MLAVALVSADLAAILGHAASRPWPTDRPTDDLGKRCNFTDFGRLHGYGMPVCNTEVQNTDFEEFTAIDIRTLIAVLHAVRPRRTDPS